MKLIYIGIAALITVTACYYKEMGVSEKPGVFFDDKAFQNHRSLWNKQSYTDYTVIERIVNYSVNENSTIAVTVKNGAIISSKLWIKESGWITFDALNNKEEYSHLLQYVMTVPEVFSHIEKMYQDALLEYKWHPDRRIEIAVSYDDLFNIPLSISLESKILGIVQQPIGWAGWYYYMGDFSLDTEKPGQPPPLQAFDTTVFMAEQAAWKNLGIERYRFTLRAATDAGPQAPVTVTVPDAPPPEGGPLVFASIDSLCEFITNANSEHGASGAALKIRYNAAYHYPEAFSFRPPNADGGGYEIGITDFEPER